MTDRLDDMTDAERARLFPVILSAHKPVWKTRFVREMAKLEEVLGTRDIVRISHIGSTAVPGLIAKPTIDILVEISNDTDTVQLISNVQKLEYRYLGQQSSPPPPHWYFIKGYTPEGFKGQVFHVHVRYAADWDEIRFRDYLLAHPETADEYGRLKQDLKQRYEYDRDAYTLAKTAFIKRVCELAREVG